MVHLCNYSSKSGIIIVSKVGLPRDLVYTGIIHLEGELLVNLFLDNHRKSV